MAKQRKEADPLDSIESLIAFWREAGEGGLWFEKNEAFDHRFRERFLDLHLEAARRRDSWLASALPDRHLHRSDHHLPILTMMHRPIDHQLAVQVEHHAQEQLAFQGGNLRDVHDPFALRLKGGEVSL
nr:hypothetical protein [Pseudomonas aeruginosa]EKV3073164.1 hypothetical protein [Pseudomonas aeruginosa]